MKSKTKVLIASGSRHSIPPLFFSPGVPRIIYQLTEKDSKDFQFFVLSKYNKALKRLNFDTRKFLHPKSGFFAFCFNIYINLMPYRWRKKKYGLSHPDRIVYYLSLVKEAKKLNPDIVVSFMHIELFKLLRKALPNAKHVFFFRSTDLKGRIGQADVNFLLRHSAGFLANTKAPVRELKTISSNILFPMDTIYNAVPEVTLSNDEHSHIGATFRIKFGLSATDFVLGYAGRFSEEKSLMELFGVMKELKSSEIIVHLIIAGDIANEKTPNQKYYKELMDYREEHLKEQIHFAGWITNAELYNFYCSLNLGVLLSKYREGNSMFLIEAMSYGIPVIATAVGGNKEIITNGNNGILIRQENLFEDLKESLKQLLIDKENYKIMSMNARSYIFENHSEENMAIKFHNFIKRV